MALGTIEGSTAIYSGYSEKLEIHGEKGNFILEGGKIVQWQCKDNTEKASQKGVEESGASDPLAVNYLFHKAQIEAFTKSVSSEKSPTINGEEALKSLEVIRAIYESSKTGKQVFL